MLANEPGKVLGMRQTAKEKFDRADKQECSVKYDLQSGRYMCDKLIKL